MAPKARAAVSSLSCTVASARKIAPNTIPSDTRSMVESRRAPFLLSSPRSRATLPSKTSSMPATSNRSPGTSRRPVRRSHPATRLTASDRIVSCHALNPTRYRPARTARYGHWNTHRNSGPITLGFSRGAGRSRMRGAGRRAAPVGLTS
jgi:hypothetical protein